MEVETIILIFTNIIVPIVVAIITGAFQKKKYKKEIQILNLEHQNKEREMKLEFEHNLELEKMKNKNEVDKLKMQFQHEEDLEQQKVGTMITTSLTNKVSDMILNQPATQKMINQKTTKQFLKNTRR